MKNIVFSVILLAFIFLTGCQQGGNKMTDESAPVAQPEAMKAEGLTLSPEKVVNEQDLPDPGSKVIKTGDITYETDRLDKMREKADLAIKKYKAYISQENEFSYPGRIEQRLLIRVPAKNFDALLAEITEGINRFDNKSIVINDVNEEFVDLEARLKTKKEVEERYRQILTRANSIQEILSVESQIGNIRAEIESYEGRLKFMQSQVSYSTLNLCFYEKVSNPVGFSSKFGRAFINGWHNLVWFFIGLINIWPFIAVVVVILILWRRVIRKRRKMKN